MDDGKVGPWAKKKLSHLGNYLTAYARIMANQVEKGWCKGFIYIDAFAGPGLHEVRQKKAAGPLQPMFEEVAEYAARYPEQREYLAGSPRVALATDPPFTRLYFVEKSPDRVEQLNALKAKFLDRDIQVRESDCNAFLKNVVGAGADYWKSHRAVIFLDPFGMQVPWSTIEMLGKTQAIDVLINFPVGMAIQRLLLRSGDFSAKERQKLDDYFGSPEWFDLLYKKQRGLFGERTEKVEQSAKALLDWYRSRLRSAFGHASQASLIRNTRKAHLYYLILASPKANAVKIANWVLNCTFRKPSGVMPQVVLGIRRGNGFLRRGDARRRATNIRCAGSGGARLCGGRHGTGVGRGRPRANRRGCRFPPPACARPSIPPASGPTD